MCGCESRRCPLHLFHAANKYSASYKGFSIYVPTVLLRITLYSLSWTWIFVIASHTYLLFSYFIGNWFYIVFAIAKPHIILFNIDNKNVMFRLQSAVNTLHNALQQLGLFDKQMYIGQQLTVVYTRCLHDVIAFSLTLLSTLMRCHWTFIMSVANIAHVFTQVSSEITSNQVQFICCI